MIFACSKERKKTKKSHENRKQFENRIFNEFQELMIVNKYYFENLEITFINENRKTYIEVYEHVTKDTKVDKINKKKNYTRKLTCHLVFEILNCAKENMCSNILIRNDKSFKNRIVLLCTSLNYKIVIERQEKSFLFITGYPINSSQMDKEIKKTTPYTHRAVS